MSTLRKSALGLSVCILLSACQVEGSRPDHPPRRVSFVNYVHDMSCWGETRNGLVSFSVQVIATEIGSKEIVLFPLAPHCEISDEIPWQYIPNVYIGSIQNNQRAVRSLGFRSITFPPPERFPIDSESLLYQVSAVCRPFRPKQEPNSLVFEDCAINNIERGGRLPPNFFATSDERA